MKQTTQPRILKVRQGSKKEIVGQAAEALMKGCLVVLPTDTVYGIAADPRVPGAEERLFEAKYRGRGKPITLLAAGIAEVERYGAQFGGIERRLAERFWPGALTLVLELRVPNSEFRIRKTEGFRVPDCEIALAILSEVGGILRVTSANRSGQHPALTADEAMVSLGPFVDIVIDAGTVPGGTPSSVVKVENEEIKVLREGAITADALSGIPRPRRGKHEVYHARGVA